jgi:transcriptional regulator with XRE-family HTH domain
MHGGELIREARRRSGVTQTRLASDLATSQSVIVRWERGERSPTFETVVKALKACGLDLRIGLVPSDNDPSGVAASMAHLTPEQKLQANRNLVALRGIASSRAGG